MEVFNRPANAFVAGFIGSAPINFFPVTFEVENGTPALITDGLRLGLESLEPAAREKINASGLTAFTLGIRPQDIHLPGDQAVRGLDDNRVRARVDVTEPMGEHVVVVVTIGHHTVKATLPNDAAYKADDLIELAVNTRAIHLFDPATESAVL